MAYETQYIAESINPSVLYCLYGKITRICFNLCLIILYRSEFYHGSEEGTLIIHRTGDKTGSGKGPEQ